jgi:hypothetical protein
MKKEIVMKNTVKKILALVFVVAMVCSLAVPAFAADEFTKYSVDLIIVDSEGKPVSKTVEIASAKKANVLDALKAAEGTVESVEVDLSFKNNVLTGANVTGLDFETDDEFGTESIVVALNGKAITTDLSTVAVAKDDVIVVYWADATIGTKLVVVDDSNIAAGIVSFYYYDAEGNKVPFVGATVGVSVKGGAAIDNKLAVTETPVYADDPNSDDPAVTIVERVEITYGTNFVTDEKGQIWLAPEYLDDVNSVTYVISSLAANANDMKDIKDDDKNYTDEERDYFNKYNNTYIVDEAVKAYEIVLEKNLYDVAGQTGDMTVVYALVAFAAVATLAAVVVMKKKSVKAN